MLQWKNEWGAKLITSHGSSNSRGVAIMIKNNLDCTIHHTVLDPMGRYLILKADIEDTTYLLINVYAPNQDKDLKEFFKILLNTLKRENLDSEENIVMGGDFNCPLSPAIDKKGGTLNERKSVISCIRDCLPSFLCDLNVLKLSEEQKIKCEGKISSKECFDLVDK